jgi:hypothetical protein
MRLHKNSRWAFAILPLLALLAFGCASDTGSRAFTLSSEGVSIKTILLLPFKDMAAELGVDRNVRCPLCGQVSLTGPVPPEAPMVLTEQLRSKVEQLPYAFLFSEESPNLSPSPDMSSNMLDHYVALGRQAGADAVLIGYVFRYTERVGNRYSIQSPASVAFDLHLISTKEARIVWTSYFDETQQSLTENLLKADTFFRRGATWIRADELASSGMDDMMQRFPKP